MGNCCHTIDSNNSNELNTTDKSNIIKDFDTIVTTLNPFYGYNLRLIEEIERRYYIESIPLENFFDLWLTGFLNFQVKSVYKYCKVDLDKIFNEESITEVVFLNLLMLTLSPSNNTYSKKEYICYLVINKYFSKDMKNYSLLINSVIDLITICVKISICFVFIFFIFNSEQTDFVRQIFKNTAVANNIGVNGAADDCEIEKKILIRQTTNFRNSVQLKTKILHFDHLNPYFTIDDEVESGIFNFSILNKNLNSVCSHLFYVISNYGIKTHSSYEKYLDYVVSYSLKKLFFIKTDFSTIREDEIKEIIHDIIEIIDVWKLFELIFK